MTDKFVSFSEYRRSRPILNGEFTRENLQTEWYRQHIHQKTENIQELIRNDIVLAYKIFVKFDDRIGLKMIIEDQNSEDVVRRNAQMQLESIDTDRFDYTTTQREPHSLATNHIGVIMPLHQTFGLSEIRCRKLRYPIRADIVYSGS